MNIETGYKTLIYKKNYAYPLFFIRIYLCCSVVKNISIYFYFLLWTFYYIYLCLSVFIRGKKILVFVLFLAFIIFICVYPW